MSAVSLLPSDRARKALTMVLQRLGETGTAVSVAAAMGVSESTVSRIKTERMEEVLQLIAHLGLKVVPADFKCVDRESYDFLVRSHKKVMEKRPELIWETEE